MTPIAHVLPDTGPHLNAPISQLILEQFPDARIYLREECHMFVTNKGISDNFPWISKLPRGVYRGILAESFLFKRINCSGYIDRIRSLIVPHLSFLSIFRILIGPRRWVVHGRGLSFPTILLMRIMGKKVSVIHWGGRVHFVKTKSSWFEVMSHRLLAKFYVLMEPEVTGFADVFGKDRVAVLSYPDKNFEGKSFRNFFPTVNLSTRSLILGNSGYSRDLYPSILEKLRDKGWGKIVCMMNYGRELESGKNSAFREKYQAAFGGAFYYWQETVPLNEYLKIIKEPSVYIGPQTCQSGLGAIYYSVMAGRAVFLKGDNLSWLNKLGVRVYDIDKITDWSCDKILEFVPNDKEYQENVQALIRYFTECNSVSQWRERLISDLG